MLRWSLLILSSAFFGQAAWAAPLGCPKAVRIGFNDTASPPMLMGQGERFEDPPGWQVVAVREALKRLDCAVDAELVRMPARRLSVLLSQGQLDVALLYGITPERLRTMSFPRDARGQPDLAWAPVFGRLVLFGRPGRPPQPAWDGQQLPPGWRVGVMAGSVQEAFARGRGWAVEPITALDFGMQMLNAKRFDLLLTSREALSPEQRAGVVEWATTTRMPFFAPASVDFSQRHPGWMRSFWNEFCRAVRRLEPEVRPVDCGIVPPGVGR